jgi:ribosome biogenesis GTPase / thiamine phosphate phosphatase
MRLRQPPGNERYTPATGLVLWPVFILIKDFSMDSSNTTMHDQGVVVKKNIGSYQVRTNGRILPCAISSRLRKQLIYTADNPNALHHRVNAVKTLDREDPVAVGDLVRFVEAGAGSGLITEVLPRRNRLSRRDPYPGAHAFEQIIVANVDYIVPVFAAANPTPKWGMLDRYLASAESLELSVLIVLTKLDLVRDSEGRLDDAIRQAVDEYRRIGYPVLLTSSLSGEGLEALRQVLKGRVSAFVGKSGVGKTALLNALEPGLGLRVGEVGLGKVGKGKHTTSSAEMVTTAFGADIVDTPGMREFGLQDMDAYDLALFFPEMRPFVGQCRFGLDCLHDEEPGCAIRRQVMAGEISPLRYKSYLRLKEEV